MKQLILFSISIFCSLFLNAQNPLIKQWDARFGGNGTDWFTCFKQTKDGGFILGGYSYCGISGDKTQANWGYSDYWVVKIAANGAKQWDKDFGGTNDDVLLSVAQTNDGGYILGGYSYSGISGDKTQACWGDRDYWIIKIDSNGTKQWDKDFGGGNGDLLSSIQQTTDGGYMLGGFSGSGIGGDKTQGCWGPGDYWIVKIDSNGTKQWDKDFGGTDDDELYSMQQTSDGGYIMGGRSYSGSGGDKTQGLWGGGVAPDFWIVKVDSLGIKQWDKDFGGINYEYFYSLQQTTDEGYILGGFSYSGISGDKTQASKGMSDYWIVKIDSSGTKQWDKDFGASYTEDDFGSVNQTADGGYLLCGNSVSPIGGDKTESNLGQSQAWIVKTDSLGNKEWDKTIFTNPELKIFPYALQTKEGCYAVAEGSAAGIAGYRTEDNWDTSYGSQDYFIVTFCDSTHMPPVASVVANSNLCPGTCTSFLNLSQYATSFQWSFPGAIPDTSNDASPAYICYNTPGIYDIILVASNSSGSYTLVLNNFIVVYPQPPPQSISQNGDTLFAIAGATSYQWYFNTNVINGATNYFYVAPASGDYNVVATDLNGCEVEAAIFNVISNVSSKNSEGLYITLSPALSSEKLMIISEKLIFQVSIFDILGTRLFSGVVNNHKSEINIHSYSNGLYFIQLQTEGGNISKRFIKD